MTLPSKADISPTSGVDLDEIAALEHFYGKNQSDATKLFFEDPLYYEEDLKWMGSKAFVFYFPSIEPYLLSKESEGDADIVNALIGTVKSRLEDDPLTIKECQTPVLRILTFVSEGLEKFQVDPAINGDVAGELSDLIDKVQAVSW